MGRRKIYSERFNKQYKTYKKYYRAKERYFEKMNKRNELKGKPQRYKMREEMFSKTTYYANYKDYKRVLEEEGIKNPNVNQYIVADQAYTRSQKQYRGIKKAIKEDVNVAVALNIPKGFNELNFRTGNVDIDWDEVKETYREDRFDFGWSVKDTMEHISNLYFGSK